MLKRVYHKQRFFVTRLSSQKQSINIHCIIQALDHTTSSLPFAILKIQAQLFKAGGK